MKNNSLTVISRSIIALCAIALIAVLFFPMWQIQLAAPQYPEGLVLLIYPDKLGGNVDIINGLNHYIGMRAMHTEDFFEFKVLPYIIMFFSAALLLLAVIGRRSLLYLVFVLFVCFGIVAMIDFWKWEYDYGHNLNPDAAIVVPGMAYQPPLIGFKQLLNFGAYSIPDVGGWIFVSVGVILLILVITEWYKSRKLNLPGKIAVNSVILLFCVFLSSCSSGPDPIQPGKDNCEYCKMTVTDVRFGAEIVTKKGRVYKFDDSHCLLSYLKEKNLEQSALQDIYFTDFCNDHNLTKSGSALLLRSDQLKSPMSGNIAAFSNADSLKSVMNELGGSVITWNELNKP